MSISRKKSILCIKKALCSFFVFGISASYVSCATEEADKNNLCIIYTDKTITELEKEYIGCDIQEFNISQLSSDNQDNNGADNIPNLSETTNEDRYPIKWFLISSDKNKEISNLKPEISRPEYLSRPLLERTPQDIDNILEYYESNDGRILLDYELNFFKALSMPKFNVENLMHWNAFIINSYKEFCVSKNIKSNKVEDLSIFTYFKKATRFLDENHPTLNYLNAIKREMVCLGEIYAVSYIEDNFRYANEKLPNNLMTLIEIIQGVLNICGNPEYPFFERQAIFNKIHAISIGLRDFKEDFTVFMNNMRVQNKGGLIFKASDAYDDIVRIFCKEKGWDADAILKCFINGGHKHKESQIHFLCNDLKKACDNLQLKYNFSHRKVSKLSDFFIFAKNKKSNLDIFLDYDVTLVSKIINNITIPMHWVVENNHFIILQVGYTDLIKNIRNLFGDLNYSVVSTSSSEKSIDDMVAEIETDNGNGKTSKNSPKKGKKSPKKNNQDKNTRNKNEIKYNKTDVVVETKPLSPREETTRQPELPMRLTSGFDDPTVIPDGFKVVSANKKNKKSESPHTRNDGASLNGDSRPSKDSSHCKNDVNTKSNIDGKPNSTAERNKTNNTNVKIDVTKHDVTSAKMERTSKASINCVEKNDLKQDEVYKNNSNTIPVVTSQRLSTEKLEDVQLVSIVEDNPCEHFNVVEIQTKNTVAVQTDDTIFKGQNYNGCTTEYNLINKPLDITSLALDEKSTMVDIVNQQEPMHSHKDAIACIDHDHSSHLHGQLVDNYLNANYDISQQYCMPCNPAFMIPSGLLWRIDYALFCKGGSPYHPVSPQLDENNQVKYWSCNMCYSIFSK